MKAYYQSPIGTIVLEEKGGYIAALRFVDEIPDNVDAASPVLKEGVKQLEEYFAGKRKDFDLPLKQDGTLFQQKAWDYLSTIPYGETVSYKDEAVAIGSPKACRAVGSANGRNNIAVIIPCHRVVNEGKGMGGYAYGLDIKRHLLELEKHYKDTYK